jgi:hypothetical protein
MNNKVPLRCTLAAVLPTQIGALMVSDSVTAMITGPINPASFFEFVIAPSSFSS